MYAADDAKLYVHNTSITTSDIDATFVTGYVDKALGQTIRISDGENIIVKKQLPDTGEMVRFRIRIPADAINEDDITSLVVAMTDVSSDSVDSKEVAYIKVVYKEKKEQVLDVEKDTLSLKVPGDDRYSLDATVSSRLELQYKSSNENVARVDANGVIEPIGDGEAVITISQSNSSEYKPIEKEVKVSVEAQPYYTVIFHSNPARSPIINVDGKIKEREIEGDDIVEQKIAVDDTVKLMSNELIFGEFEFMGWAEDPHGKPKYENEAEVTNLGDEGATVELYAVWKGARARAALEWALAIAADDSFTYGKVGPTNKVGCYFCGTNQKRKPKGFEKTYVCMTFCCAAYAHGAQDPEMFYIDSTGKDTISTDNCNFKYDCWEKVGMCRDLTIDDLEPGDILVKYDPTNGNRGGHVCMYAGDNMLVEATRTNGDVWGPGSIAVGANATKRLKYYSSANDYVMRYKY